MRTSSGSVTAYNIPIFFSHPFMQSSGVAAFLIADAC